MSRTPYNYARTHNLRLKMVTQRDHIRARNWLAIVVAVAVWVCLWPSIMGYIVFTLTCLRLGYILCRWADAIERRSKWRNSLGKA